MAGDKLCSTCFCFQECETSPDDTCPLWEEDFFKVKRELDAILADANRVEGET